MAAGFTNISNGGGVKSLSALPSDVRMGQTFSTDGKNVLTGTMNLTNLRPENVRKDVNVAGVVGTLNTLTTVTLTERVVLTGNAGKVQNYTVPEGVKYIIATVIGGGGAGGSGGCSTRSGHKGGNGEYSWALNSTYYASGGTGGSGGSKHPNPNSSWGGSIAGAGYKGQAGNRLVILIAVQQMGNVLQYYIGRGGRPAGNTSANLIYSHNPAQNYPQTSNGSNKSTPFTPLNAPATPPYNSHNADPKNGERNRGGAGGRGYYSEGYEGGYGSSGSYGTTSVVYGGSGGNGGLGGGFGGGGAGSTPIHGDGGFDDFGGSGGYGGEGVIELLLIR